MKLTSLNYTTPNNNRYYNNEQKQQSFKGLTDGIINFWQFVDDGGRAVQFTVEDMCGTNFPRSIKGMTAGYKYTHKLNWKAFCQEAIREFLTGPTMCLVPYFIIKGAKKYINKNSNTYCENITNLSDIMKNIGSDSAEVVEKNFYTEVVKDMLTTTTGESAENLGKEIEELTGLFGQYSTEVANQAGKKGKNLKEAEQLAQKAKANLSDAFERIVKTKSAEYKDATFLKAKYTLGDRTSEIPFKNYSEYVVNYMHDIAKKFKNGNNINITPEDILKNRNLNSGIRVLVATAMFIATGIFMSVIPKLYTKASGKVNPNASRIYDEAKKENTKEAN